MPRLPTIRVVGSHAISTSWPGSRVACVGLGMMVVVAITALCPAGCEGRETETERGATYQVRRAPVVSLLRLCRQRGSLSTVRSVMCRKPRITDPYRPDAVLEILPPG